LLKVAYTAAEIVLKIGSASSHVRDIQTYKESMSLRGRYCYWVVRTECTHAGHSGMSILGSGVGPEKKRGEIFTFLKFHAVKKLSENVLVEKFFV